VLALVQTLNDDTAHRGTPHDAVLKIVAFDHKPSETSPPRNLDGYGNGGTRVATSGFFGALIKGTAITPDSHLVHPTQCTRAKKIMSKDLALDVLTSHLAVDKFMTLDASKRQKMHGSGAHGQTELSPNLPWRVTVAGKTFLNNPDARFVMRTPDGEKIIQAQASVLRKPSSHTRHAGALGRSMRELLGSAQCAALEQRGASAAPLHSPSSRGAALVASMPPFDSSPRATVDALVHGEVTGAAQYNAAWARLLRDRTVAKPFLLDPGYEEGEFVVPLGVFESWFDAGGVPLSGALRLSINLFNPLERHYWVIGGRGSDHKKFNRSHWHMTEEGPWRTRDKLQTNPWFKVRCDGMHCNVCVKVRPLRRCLKDFAEGNGREPAIVMERDAYVDRVQGSRRDAIANTHVHRPGEGTRGCQDKSMVGLMGLRNALPAKQRTLMDEVLPAPPQPRAGLRAAGDALTAASQQSVNQMCNGSLRVKKRRLTKPKAPNWSPTTSVHNAGNASHAMEQVIAKNRERCRLSNQAAAMSTCTLCSRPTYP